MVLQKTLIRQNIYKFHRLGVICLCMLFSLSVYSQEKDSTKILKDQPKAVPLPPIEAKPDGENKNTKRLDLMKDPNAKKGMLDIPETNQIQMLPKVSYRNPAELYYKQLGIKKKEPLPNFVTKTYFGNFRTKGKFIEFICRDFGRVDDDVIMIRVNEKIIYPQIYLIDEYRSYRFVLNEGINNVEIIAVNEGLLQPNTAEFKIFDEFGKELTSNYWGLKTNQKAHFIIIKEE